VEFVKQLLCGVQETPYIVGFEKYLDLNRKGKYEKPTFLIAKPKSDSSVEIAIFL